MSDETIWEMKSQIDEILLTLSEIKQNSVQRLYNTKELSAYLKIGPDVIENMRHNGELSYAKLGRTYVYTQTDVDNLIRNNHVEFVS